MIKLSKIDIFDKSEKESSKSLKSVAVKNKFKNVIDVGPGDDKIWQGCPMQSKIYITRAQCR